MFDWSDTVFRPRNVTRRRISNTVLQPRYWGREADSPEVCRLPYISLTILGQHIKDPTNILCIYQIVHVYIRITTGDRF
jgi:hypothetical protein